MFYTHKNGVSFRKLESSDLEMLKALKDESWFGTVNTTCVNMDDQRKWFEKISNDKSCLFFMAFPPALPAPPYPWQIVGNTPSPCALFGLTSIDGLNQSCEFTHSVFKERRGQGLGKATLRAGIDMAFEVFNMRRIETWILENNLAEIKTAMSVGFREEGRKREAVYKCGTYFDCVLFGLLEEEWNNTAEVNTSRHSAENPGVCNLSYVPKATR